MKVEIIPCLQDNYSYLIIDNEKQEACVVDPSEAKPIINYLNDKNIKLKYILNTHHHYDHVGGNTELKKKFGSVVLGFNGDAKRIPEIDVLLKDNEIWNSGNFKALKFPLFQISLSFNKTSISGILFASPLNPKTTDPNFFFNSVLPPT